jgi:hypothetical protein
LILLGTYIEPYFKSILKASNNLSMIIDISGICAEEDFQSFDFLQPSLKETPTEQVLQLLLTAKTDLEKQISLNDENKPFYESLLSRIMFRHTWLTLHFYGSKLTHDSYKDFKKLIKSAKYHLSLIKGQKLLLFFSIFLFFIFLFFVINFFL